MNTVIYARYSAGPRQTDQSIEGQLRVCTDFCKQRGLTVIDTYCDRHISGRTDERPEFQRLIADAKRKKFEAVVVYKTDRFARNKYDSAVYKRELKRNGIQIFYAAEAIPDGPEGIILESLMEGLAEYYSAELAQKIKRGMHESALKCQSTGSGRPLGYRVDEQKHFQIDPESAQTVQTIFEQYIKGESNAAICELLNSRGLRTAQGKPFNKNSINRIIKNRKYIGEYRYHDIVVEGGMPAIISKDTFNLAQAEMERRRTRKAPKSPKAEYLLAGRLFCGHCKGPMQGVSGTGKSGNKWYYYYCGNTRGKNKTCDKKQVSRDRLERAVVDFTVRYILQEEVLEELARKVHAAQERQNDTASEIAFYEKKLADNKKSIANVLRAIESGAATQTLPARLQELENEQAVILGEISFLKGKRLAFTEDQILFALMKHLEPYPGESEQDYRRRIISDFVSEVYLYDDRLLIYFNISSENGKLKSADLSNIEGGEFDEGLVRSPYAGIYLGRFEEQKDPMRLMRIFAGILKRCPNVRLAAVGSGSMLTETMAYAKELGISEHVDFPGYLENPYTLLAGARFLLMCSRFEGLPIAALEAGALGVPVVAVKTDGLAEAVEDGESGFLSDDDEMLIRHAAALISDDALYAAVHAAAYRYSEEINDGDAYKNKLRRTYFS